MLGLELGLGFDLVFGYSVTFAGNAFDFLWRWNEFENGPRSAGKKFCRALKFFVSLQVQLVVLVIDKQVKVSCFPKIDTDRQNTCDLQKYTSLQCWSFSSLPRSRKFCFCNRIISLWNSLPENVVIAGSLNSLVLNVD